jgi:preprotein translocase subunit Sec61beta
MSKSLFEKITMSSSKKSAPLPASSGGLMRFFEDETKGFKIDPKIIVSIPISLIVVSWAIELFITP